MTIGGALSELNNLLKAEDIPFYYKPSIKAVIDTIALSNSENPQPKTGKWIKTDEGFSPYECSVCSSIEFIESNYCPNCGAKMSEIPTDCSNLDSCENCKYDDGECCRLLYEAKMESENKE